jgi:hypothetical protein
LHRGWTDIPEVGVGLAVVVDVVPVSGGGIDAVVPTVVLERKAAVELLEVMAVCVGQLNSEVSDPGIMEVGSPEFETGRSEIVCVGRMSDTVGSPDVILKEEVFLRPSDGRPTSPEGVVQGNLGTQGSLRVGLPGTICDIVCEHVVLAFIESVGLPDVASVPVTMLLFALVSIREAVEVGNGS